MKDHQTNIRDTAYRKYQLDWMSSHGYDISDLSELASEWAHSTDSDEISFEDYLEEYGFGGELWACKDEFLEAEYQDVSYMTNLLTEEEFLEYLEESGNEILE